MAKTRTNDVDKDVMTFKVMVSKEKNPKAYEWAKSLSWGMFPKFVNDVLTLYAEKEYLLPNDWILENDTKSIELLQRSQTQQVNANSMQDLMNQMMQMQEQLILLQAQLKLQQGHFPMGHPYMHPYAAMAYPPHQQQHGQVQHLQQHSTPMQESHSQAHTDALQQSISPNGIKEHPQAATHTQGQEEEFTFTLPPMEETSPTGNTPLGGFGGEISKHDQIQSSDHKDENGQNFINGFQLY